MILSRKSAAVLALAAALVAGPSLYSQEPSFDGLPEGDKDLVVLVRQLSRRVQELESLLNACEVKSAPAHSLVPMAPSSKNDALEKVVVDAKSTRDKLEAALDGHHFPDPANAHVVYWKIKTNGDWPVVTANIKKFVTFMDAVLPRAGELTDVSTTVYSDLIRWGRGRILYRTGLGMAQQDVLAVDYGVAVVPLPPEPAPAGGR